MIDVYGKHVLILEGEPRVGAMVGRILERQGVSIESTLTCDDCLKRLSGGHCDLLIIDSNGNPEPNLELLSTLKRRCSLLPSLVLVDRGDIAMAVRAVKAGAVDCLEKPVERDRLCSSIQTILQPAPSPVLDVRDRLTAIEIEVLRQVAAGKTNRDIGVSLHRSTRTIEVHRRNLTRKLGASGIVNLIKRATVLGLIDTTELSTARSSPH
jgi:two-component system response regulator FixJ